MCLCQGGYVIIHMAHWWAGKLMDNYACLWWQSLYVCTQYALIYTLYVCSYVATLSLNICDTLILSFNYCYELLWGA